MNDQLYNEDMNNNEYDPNQLDDYNFNSYDNNNVYGDDYVQEMNYQNDYGYKPNSMKDINLLNIKMKIDLLNKKVNQMKNTFEKFDAISLNKEKNSLRNIDSYGDYNNNINSFDYDNYFLNNYPTNSMNNNNSNQYFSENIDNNFNINNKNKLNLCFGSFDNYFLNKYNYTNENIEEDNNNNENKQNYENEKNKEEYQIEKTDDSNFVNIINNNNTDNKQNEYQIEKTDENMYNDNNKIDVGKKESVYQEDINANISNKGNIENLENTNNEKILKPDIKEKVDLTGNNKNNDSKENKIDTKKQKQKMLVFCEDENVTIKYDDREKITEISIYNVSGKKLNFIPKNINVYLNKLKKMKLKSILLNGNNNNLSTNESRTKPKINKNTKKNKQKTQEQANKTKEQINKTKNQNNKTKVSNKSIPKTPNKNENIYQKLKDRIFFVKKKPSPQKKTEEPKKQEKIVLCERFRNNPQMFFKEELCDLMIESLNLDKDEILTKSLSQKDIENNNNTNKKVKNKKCKDDDGFNMKAFNNLKKYFEENQISDDEKEKK